MVDLKNRLMDALPSDQDAEDEIQILTSDGNKLVNYLYKLGEDSKVRNIWFRASYDNYWPVLEAEYNKRQQQRQAANTAQQPQSQSQQAPLPQQEVARPPQQQQAARGNSGAGSRGRGRDRVMMWRPKKVSESIACNIRS